MNRWKSNICTTIWSFIDRLKKFSIQAIAFNDEWSAVYYGNHWCSWLSTITSVLSDGNHKTWIGFELLEYIIWDAEVYLHCKWCYLGKFFFFFNITLLNNLFPFPFYERKAFFWFIVTSLTLHYVMPCRLFFRFCLYMSNYYVYEFSRFSTFLNQGNFIGFLCERWIFIFRIQFLKFHQPNKFELTVYNLKSHAILNML